MGKRKLLRKFFSPYSSLFLLRFFCFPRFIAFENKKEIVKTPLMLTFKGYDLDGCCGGLWQMRFSWGQNPVKWL